MTLVLARCHSPLYNLPYCGQPFRPLPRNVAWGVRKASPSSPTPTHARPIQRGRGYRGRPGIVGSEQDSRPGSASERQQHSGIFPPTPGRSPRMGRQNAATSPFSNGGWKTIPATSKCPRGSRTACPTSRVPCGTRFAKSRRRPANVVGRGRSSLAAGPLARPRHRWPIKIKGRPARPPRTMDALEALEEQIDECLSVAEGSGARKTWSRSSYLSCGRARNAVVMLKMGE